MRWRSALRVLFCFFLILFLSAVANANKKKPPAKPENILQMRKSYGAFKSVDDLLAIRGLGPKRLEKMRKYLTIGKPAPAKSGALPAKSALPVEKPPDKP